MPVGRRRSVWTSHSWSSLRRTVSPAPPSNSTLSGTTTAARPCTLSSDLTCWTKLLEEGGGWFGPVDVEDVPAARRRIEQGDELRDLAGAEVEERQRRDRRVETTG